MTRTLTRAAYTRPSLCCNVSTMVGYIDQDFKIYRWKSIKCWKCGKYCKTK